MGCGASAAGYPGAPQDLQPGMPAVIQNRTSGPRTPADLQPGMPVVIQNVSDPKHAHINGVTGTISHFDNANKRWQVKGPNGQPYLLKKSNLKVVVPQQQQVTPLMLDTASTVVKGTCNYGHSLVWAKLNFDPKSPDPNMRRPILCDDCVELLSEKDWGKGIINAEYAMQCKDGCDFALCQKHYDLRVTKAQASNAAPGQASKGAKPKASGGQSCPSAWPSQEQPDTKKISFQDPRSGNRSIGVIAFYFPGQPLLWDTMCRGGFLGNFWDLRPDHLVLEGTANGMHTTHSFGNAEAAFQALKFWSFASAFEPLSGDAAFQEKRRMAGHEDRSYAGHGSNWEGMWAVLKAKFKLKSMEGLLLKTEDSFLLEHNSVQGRDDVWSDNCDGTGTNWLGLQLMLMRDELRKAKTWTPYIKKWINTETGAFLNSAGEETWRVSVRQATKALIKEMEKLHPGQLLPSGNFRCLKASCGKPTWNGQPNEYCSKACKTSNFMAAYSVPFGGMFGSAAAQAPPRMAPTCNKPGCGKPTWNGMPNEYCSRSCRTEDQAVTAFPAQPSPTMGHGGHSHMQVAGSYRPPQCLRASCGKPTWNGMPNEYCSKGCRPQHVQQPARAGNNGMMPWAPRTLP